MALINGFDLPSATWHPMLERYHSSGFKFCTEKSIARSPSRPDAFTFVLEVPNQLRRAATARDS